MAENQINEFEIILYTKENGEIPVDTFIDSIDNKMKAKILMGIRLLKENGNQLREPYTKHLEDGIFELRAKVGNDISRVLYFFVIGRKIVFTNGFIKKTQKTPRKEIELAKKYRNDYLNKEEY